MIAVEDRALISRLVGDRFRVGRSGSSWGSGRATMDPALASDPWSPRYERPGDGVRIVQGRVRAVPSEHSEMPATVVAERVGRRGSITWLAQRAPVAPRNTVGRQVGLGAGDTAQCDLWFPPKRITLEDGSSSLLPMLVIVAALGIDQLSARADVVGAYAANTAPLVAVLAELSWQVEVLAER